MFGSEGGEIFVGEDADALEGACAERDTEPAAETEVFRAEGEDEGFVVEGAGVWRRWNDFEFLGFLDEFAFCSRWGDGGIG